MCANKPRRSRRLTRRVTRQGSRISVGVRERVYSSKQCYKIISFDPPIFPLLFVCFEQYNLMATLSSTTLKLRLTRIEQKLKRLVNTSMKHILVFVQSIALYTVLIVYFSLENLSYKSKKLKS